MVKPKSISDKKYQTKKEGDDFKKKLRQLTDASNLPAYMGELFLTEIKLSTDQANAHLRERAKLLGLI